MSKDNPIYKKLLTQFQYQYSPQVKKDTLQQQERKVVAQSEENITRSFENFRSASVDPRYLSPIHTNMGHPDQFSVVGCSVCSTRGYPSSQSVTPPRMIPSDTQNDPEQQSKQDQKPESTKTQSQVKQSVRLKERRSQTPTISRNKEIAKKRNSANSSTSKMVKDQERRSASNTRSEQSATITKRPSGDTFKLKQKALQKYKRNNLGQKKQQEPSEIEISRNQSTENDIMMKPSKRVPIKSSKVTKGISGVVRNRNNSSHRGGENKVRSLDYEIDLHKQSFFDKKSCQERTIKKEHGLTHNATLLQAAANHAAEITQANTSTDLGFSSVRKIVQTNRRARMQKLRAKYNQSKQTSQQLSKKVVQRSETPIQESQMQRYQFQYLTWKSQDQIPQEIKQAQEEKIPILVQEEKSPSLSSTHNEFQLNSTTIAFEQQPKTQSQAISFEVTYQSNTQQQSVTSTPNHFQQQQFDIHKQLLDLQKIEISNCNQQQITPMKPKFSLSTQIAFSLQIQPKKKQDEDLQQKIPMIHTLPLHFFYRNSRLNFQQTSVQIKPQNNLPILKLEYATSLSTPPNNQNI